MNQSLFLSIIIPVYNAASCIKRCLDSIWAQGMNESEYEVICVNDCSTDNTLEVLEEIQKSHPNMKVVSNTANLRAGGSRNHGVRLAGGKYICFIDADDYYHEASLKKAITLAKRDNLDILVCDFARHSEVVPNDKLVHCFPDENIMSGRDFMLTNSLPYAPWKYIFKKSLMVEHDIWFEECVSCEDVDWTHKMALYAGSMKYEPILLVHYILMPTSQTAAEFKRKESVFYRLFSGFRVAQLEQLCHTKEEKAYINSVAEATSWNGVIFLNALFISPLEKNRVLKKYLQGIKGKKIELIRKFSFLYSLFSTLIAPLFRTLIILKRKFGR